MLLQTIFLVLLYLVLFFTRWKKLKKKAVFLNTLMYIYVCLVLFVTILPIDLTLNLKWEFHSSIDFSYGNLKPFNDLLLGRGGSVRGVILNVVMMVPFGFLYSLLKKTTLIKTIVATFLFSLSIELVQLIMTIFLLNYRIFDVTDLIVNTIGGSIGFILSKIYYKNKKGG